MKPLLEKKGQLQQIIELKNSTKGDWVEEVFDSSQKLLEKFSEMPLSQPVPEPMPAPQMLIDSKILCSNAQKEFVFKEIANSQELSLLYRGTSDGFGMGDYHKKVDDQGATISVIETTAGDIIGGFTTVPWTRSHHGELLPDKQACLFSVNHSQKMRVVNEKQAVTYHKEQLATFAGSLITKD